MGVMYERFDFFGKVVGWCGGGVEAFATVYTQVKVNYQ
jgi:hypothetical protein